MEKDKSIKVTPTASASILVAKPCKRIILKDKVDLIWQDFSAIDCLDITCSLFSFIMSIMILIASKRKIVAVINLVKARKSALAKIVTLRNISLSDASVSIFALQRSMLVSFGDMPETDIQIFNAVIGAAVCVIVFLLGLNLVKNKKTI